MAATTFKFDSRTNNVLEELREHYGASSKAEVLRKAIALLDIAAEAEDNNQQVVVVSPDGSDRRQVIVR